MNQTQIQTHAGHRADIGPEPGEQQISTWRVPDDLQRLGRVQDSALLTPHFLLRRSDGQVVQVSELLNAVVEEIEPSRSADEIAEAVSDAYGRTLTVEGLCHLVESRLVPLGVVEDTERPPATPPPTAIPLLSLSLRGTLFPERAVRRLAAVLEPLFWPPTVVAVLVGLVAMDVVLLERGDLMVALQQMLATPTTLLVLYVLLTLGAIVHELGHATACRYGGAEPGRIGVGVYLVFPVFYTDVTDSYRLGRAGRVRTDLGGLYFNIPVLLGCGVAYLATGNGLLLLAVLITHIEMLQQLVPAVRLDGYYVLADLIGVPDLFSRVGPVLRSLVPGRASDPRVLEMRPGTRRIVIAWVLVVVPALTAGFLWLLWNLPLMVQQTALAAQVQLEQLTIAWSRTDVVVVIASVFSLVLLLVPLAGVAVLIWRMVSTVSRVVWRVFAGSSAQDAYDDAAAQQRRYTASAFNDEEMLPVERGPATLGWQRWVYRASGHVLKPRPGAEERRREQRAELLRTPIEGTRRVVVMSRKGGVGKTTISLALGSILATQRGDRVVALDANPDAGNLAHRVAPANGLTITDVLRDLDRIGSYAALKAYTSQAPESRLEVLASDDDSRIGIALDREDYHRLITLLDRFYNLILLDTGTGILDSANQGLLTEADQLVLVLRAGLDGGRAAALTLDWLDAHDYAELVRDAVVVINAVRPRVGAPLAPIREHFEHRCRRVLTIPWDPALETGAQTRLSGLRPETEEALVEMAAAVAEHLPATRTVR